MNNNCLIRHLEKEYRLESKYRHSLAGQLREFLRDCEYHEKGRSEHKLFTFLADVIPLGIVITNEERKIEWINRAYAELSGYSLEEAAGRKPGELFQNGTIDRQKAKRMARRLEREVPFTEELKNYGKNGEAFWVRITICPVYDRHGKLQNFIGVQEDITERKRKDRELVRDSKILEALSEQANFSIFLKDEESKYVFVNPEWRKQFSLTRDEVIGKTVFDLFDTATAKKLDSQDREVLREQQSFLEEEFIQYKDRPRYYSISKFPVTNIPGVSRGVAGIATDVTKLKMAEEKVRRSELQLKRAQRISHIGSWELDLINNELTWSDEIYRIFEMDPDEFDASYEAFLALVHPSDREEVDRMYTKSIKEEKTYHIIHRLQFPGGRIKYVEEQGEHYYDNEGSAVQTIGTVQDVTEKELIQRRLRESLREKNALLAEIHHRVKNNLAVVSGMLQLQWLEEENPKIAQKLQSSLNRIKAIAGIHEQLYKSDQFAKVDLGKHLSRLCRDLIETMQTDTDLNVHCDCDTIELLMTQTLPCSLIANEVITNIIKHAFTGRAKGEIRISLHEDNGLIRMEISDDGKGMPDNFEGERKGTLGMHLIENLSKQLEGRYNYQSSSQGTKFTLHFMRQSNV